MVRGMIVALAAALAGLGACATEPSYERMAVPLAAELMVGPGHPGYHAVGPVTVTGGDKGYLHLANIHDADFTDALEVSLDNAGFLGEENGPVAVDAQILQIGDGGMLTVTASMDVQYTVRRGRRQVMREVALSDGAENVTSTFVGIERTVKAYEEAVRENIREFIVRLKAGLK